MYGQLVQRAELTQHRHALEEVGRPMHCGDGTAGYPVSVRSLAWHRGGPVQLHGGAAASGGAWFAAHHASDRSGAPSQSKSVVPHRAAAPGWISPSPSLQSSPPHARSWCPSPSRSGHAASGAPSDPSGPDSVATASVPMSGVAVASFAEATSPAASGATSGGAKTSVGSIGVLHAVRSSPTRMLRMGRMIATNRRFRNKW
jgi:hypothetical protein